MLLVLTTLCLAMILVTACGKKGDLYLPETKVPETKAPEKVQTETTPDKTETQKKEQKEPQE